MVKALTFKEMTNKDVTPACLSVGRPEADRQHVTPDSYRDKKQ